MSDYTRQHAGHECPPPEHPAPQPQQPGDTCDKLPESKAPDVPPPEKCSDPVPPCTCPSKPGSSPNCFEKLIDAQTAQITVTEKAKAFKADLEALLAKARVADQEYTRDKYDKLVKQWVEQDDEIAVLIRKLVCAVPCWRCVIECYVCPLINELHYAEQWLYGGAPYSEVHNLYDKRYWHERDLDAKQRTFQRIKSVLAAWEKPAQTIEKILVDNAKLISDAGKSLGSDAPKVVYDVFLRLVPMHLAIAPPAIAAPERSAWTTKIDEKYTQFCICDTEKPDVCCGPDVGAWSPRQRLIGPQPYLIDPKDYFKVICCLVEHRYRPAKDAVAEAEAAFQRADNDIQRRKAQIENGLKSFDKDAKGAIPNVIDCCDDDLAETDSKPLQTR